MAPLAAVALTLRHSPVPSVSKTRRSAWSRSEKFANRSGIDLIQRFQPSNSARAEASLLQVMRSIWASSDNGQRDSLGATVDRGARSVCVEGGLKKPVEAGGSVVGRRCKDRDVTRADRFVHTRYCCYAFSGWPIADDA